MPFAGIRFSVESLFFFFNLDLESWNNVWTCQHMHKRIRGTIGQNVREWKCSGGSGIYLFCNTGEATETNTVGRLSDMISLNASK